MKEPVATLSFNGKSHELDQRQLAMIAGALMLQAERYSTTTFYRAFAPLAETLEAMEKSLPPLIHVVCVPFSFREEGTFNLSDHSPYGDFPNVEVLSIGIFSVEICGKVWTAEEGQGDLLCEFIQKEGVENKLVVQLRRDGLEVDVDGSYDCSTGVFWFCARGREMVSLKLQIKYSVK